MYPCGAHTDEASMASWLSKSELRGVVCNTPTPEGMVSKASSVNSVVEHLFDIGGSNGRDTIEWIYVEDADIQWGEDRTVIFDLWHKVQRALPRPGAVIFQQRQDDRQSSVFTAIIRTDEGESFGLCATPIAGGAMIVPASIWEDGGGLDDAGAPYGSEDIVLQQKLLEEGFFIYCWLGRPVIHPHLPLEVNRVDKPSWTR